MSEDLFDHIVASAPLGAGDPALDEACEPVLFNPAAPAEAAALARLRASGRVWKTHDTIATQLADLVKTRAFGRVLPPVELDAAVARLLDGCPLAEFGRWVFFPWSGTLAHILARPQFRELRLDRNRNKITAEEQVILDGKTVGVVGLSVGNVIAYVMAQEGSVGHLKLADFDRLDLSNLNRLHGGVHQIGVRKTVLAARQILELDPYLRVTLFHDGLTEANLDEFVAGLDVLIDECDGWLMKIAMRHAARRARVPVVMDTNDRGLLDVERFDLEPDRALLHGLLATEDLEALRAMSPADRMGVALDMAGGKHLSTRFAASLLEVNRTLATWPQLAADVALGGATVGTAVRRILLGQEQPSGRRYLDLDEQLVAPGHERAPASAFIAPAAPETAVAGVSPLMSALIEAAICAPSGGNNQPWRFRVEGETAWVIHDAARDGILETGGRSPRLALGAAVENMVIAAAGRGLAVKVTPFPFASDPTVVAEVAVAGPAGPDEQRLARLAARIPERRTNRRPGARGRIREAELDALAGAASDGCSFELRDLPAELDEAAALIAEGDRIRLTVAELHAGCVAALRFTDAEARRRRDGIDLATMGMTSGDRAVADVITRPDVAAVLRAQGAGSGLGAGARAAVAGASAVVMMRPHVAGPAGELATGRALERVWLTATELGLAVYPVCVLPILIDLLDSPERGIYTPAEIAHLEALAARLDRLFPLAVEQPRLFMFLLSRAPEMAARSLRRPFAAQVNVAAAGAR